MKKRAITPYLYILPALILALVFSYYPFFNSLILSFSKVSGSGKILSSNGFNNYIKLFSNPTFYESIKNTLIFTLIFIPINIVLVVSAALLSEKDNKINKVSQTLFFLPMALSMSSAALLFKFILSPNGIVNSLLHTNIPFLTNSSWSRISLVLLSLFLDFGLNYILVLSALKNVDNSVKQAAELDGESSWKLFFSIKLPLIMPTLSFVFIIALKNALLICAPVMVLTEGGPYNATQTIVYYYYLEAFRNFNYASASTISVVVFIFAIVLVGIYNTVERRRQRV